MQIASQTVESGTSPEPDVHEKERGKPRPDFVHSVVEVAIGAQLHAGAGDRYQVALEIILEFSDGLVMTPDISVMKRRPIDWAREPERCRDLPLMVVEIVPPSQGYATTVARIDAYFAHSVQSVWEVNTISRCIMIHHPGEERPQIVQRGEAMDPATGLTVRLEDVFA